MLIIFDNRLERNFIMTIELIKQLLDACYLAKRAREMLPAKANNGPFSASSRKARYRNSAKNMAMEDL